MKRLVVSVLALLVLATGCSRESDVPDLSQNPAAPSVTEGQKFVSSGFKIRTVITPQTVATLDPMTFEVYVDGSGNGSGLMGYQDKVYSVIIVGDKLYVKVESNIAVQVSDFSGHLIPSALDVSSISNMSDAGFVLLDGSVVSYSTSTQDWVVNGTYQYSDATFTADSITTGNSMTVASLINYILDYEGQSFIDLPDDEPSTFAKESFYVNSDWGVTIEDQVYSIGDYIEPTTYFGGMLPSGITSSYAYNKDTRVEMVHTTYMSSKGNTEVMSTDGYVQSFSTTANFKWLDIETGMSRDEVQKLAGLNLKKKDQETFKPMREGLTAEKGKTNAFIFKYDDVTVTITIGSKDRSVNGITMTRYLDFLDN